MLQEKFAIATFYPLIYIYIYKIGQSFQFLLPGCQGLVEMIIFLKIHENNV